MGLLARLFGTPAPVTLAESFHVPTPYFLRRDEDKLDVLENQIGDLREQRRRLLLKIDRDHQFTPDSLIQSLLGDLQDATENLGDVGQAQMVAVLDPLCESIVCGTLREFSTAVSHIDVERH